MSFRSYHLLAIGGVGMSGLAQILLQKGCAVSGSDMAENEHTLRLHAMGAVVHIGYAAAHIPPDAVVVYSTAIQADNPEWQAARAQQRYLWHRSRLLAELMTGFAPLLVAGTHGKTTTSSLLAHTLACCSLRPAYSIGGVVHSQGSNGAYGSGPYFVAEACESDGTFLEYPAFGAILTNIDNDHLDFWCDRVRLVEGFRQFMSGVRSEEHLVYCSDDEDLHTIQKGGIGYGFDPRAQGKISHFSQEGWGICFDLAFRGHVYPNISVPLLGRHNALNATAVFLLCVQLGIPPHAICSAFRSFTGISRRVEKKGMVAGIEIYDDYAHHPTEITATIAGLKAAEPHRRLVVVFQPHRYSRTRDCMEQFATAFSLANFVCVTDIYSAGEAPIAGVTIDVLTEKLAQVKPGAWCYCARDRLADSLMEVVQPGDLLLTMGAGDITYLGQEVLVRWHSAGV